MIIELFDQVARNESGGDMGKYLSQNIISNEQFVQQRIGINNYKLIRKNYSTITSHHINGIVSTIIKKVKDILRRNKFVHYYLTGRFRYSGDVHYAMYDRYSLHRLLAKCKFGSINVMTASTSSIDDWERFGLDIENGIVHAPLSLFMEGKK